MGDIGNNVLNKYMGGRKFVALVLILLMSSFMLWHNKLDGSLYQTLNMTVAIAFIAGNVYEGVATIKK